MSYREALLLKTVGERDKVTIVGSSQFHGYTDSNEDYLAKENF